MHVIEVAVDRKHRVFMILDDTANVAKQVFFELSGDRILSPRDSEDEMNGDACVS